MSAARGLAVCALLLLSLQATGIDIVTIDDPALRARYEVLVEELRCLVCQNQTIGDSNAELAVDLRTQVRDMLQAGRSDAEIRDYMTERYGDFVLYKPPLRTRTVALWFAPAVALLLGVLFVYRVVRQNQRLAPTDSDIPAD